MRISVQGENDAAAELKGLLRHEGYLVTDIEPTHTIYLDEMTTPDSPPESGGEGWFVVDGIDCPLEKRVMEHIHQLTRKNPHLARIGGCQSDRELRIAFAPEDAHEVAVGVFRGLLDVLIPEEARSQKPVASRYSWWRRIFR